MSFFGSSDSHLAFAVGAQPFWGLAALTLLGELRENPVREHYGRRHHLRSFVGSVPKHNALVARALLRGLLALGFSGIDTLRYVGGLLCQQIR